MRRLCLGLAVTLVLAAAVAFATGWLTVVATHGNSMAPRMSTGDLVVVASGSSYEVGDVVAYSSDDLKQLVLHRVVALENGRYTFRGDHNTFDDPEQPTADQLIGEEILHIPHGQVWVDRLTSPPVLAALAFALLTAGGAATRNLRTRKKKPVARHAATPSPAGWLAGIAPRTRTAAAVAAITTVTGLALGGYAWTQPTTAATGVSADGSRMTFSYTASVPRSPAYDTTTVTAPDPLFRRLVDTVHLDYAYQGSPGRISVAAELSTESGWRAEVQLQPAVTFERSQHTGTIDLDLNALEARASAAATAIAIPATQVAVTIVPTVETTDGQIFTPRLTFALTPLTFQLAGDAASLTVEDTTVTADRASAHHINLAGRDIAVSKLRTAAVVLALGGLLALAVLTLASRLSREDEQTVILRRYASLLLHVEPVSSPPTRPIVDVVDFPTLARLAERYGLLIMHWTRSNIETFIVQDDGITYRYRVPAASDASTPPSPDTGLTANANGTHNKDFHDDQGGKLNLL